MSYLIKTEAELKSFTGVSIALHVETLIPHLEKSKAEDLIIDILGSPTYDSLLSQYWNDTLSTANEALLPYAQKALANLAVYYFLQEGGVMISDRGTTTDRNETAFQWQHKKAETFYLNAGYDALDRLIKFLIANTDDYANWSKEEYLGHQGNSLLNSVELFQQYVNINSSYRSYKRLLPTLKMVEETQIRDLITPGIHDALLAKSTFNDDDKNLLIYIRPAIAHLVIAEALGSLNFEITGDGAFIYSLRSTVRNIQRSESPSEDALALQAQNFRTKGLSYLTRLENFLNENASENLYADYFNSSNYQEPDSSITAQTQTTDAKVFNAL